MSTDTIEETPLSRPAAVLILVRPIGPAAEPYLVFIRRSQKVYTHKGQISFPGGGFKPSDGSLEQAALRETQEEIGLDPATLEVIGLLAPVNTIVTGFLVSPFVAVPRDPVAPLIYQPDGWEVAAVLEIPLRALLAPTGRRDEEWVMRGQPRQVVFYQYQQTVIWGATAFILYNFFQEINDGKWDRLFPGGR